MARSRRKQGQVAEGEGKPMARALPNVCPVCGRQFTAENLDIRAEMPAHFVSHAPAEGCRNCGEKHVSWKIDWDGVSYPRPDVSLFFCDPCGRYAPVIVTEEVSPSGEA
jgi:hypothetical protein